MKTLIVVLLIAYVGIAAGLTAQEAMYNIAKSCPGVGDARVVVDSAHVGVTIAPGKYAMPLDIENAVATIINGYSQLLFESPGYQGYLRVGIAEQGRDDQYYITTIYEATATEARGCTTLGGVSSEYIDYVMQRGKVIAYSNYVWPGVQDRTDWNGWS
jgi:hypothetical protein